MATKAQRLIDQAVAELQKTTLGYRGLKPPTSGHWAEGLHLLAGARASLDPPPKPARPRVDLGPVLRGGLPVLEHDLTHATGGLPGFPAFDDGMGHPGMVVIAPEAMLVTGHGHAQRRDGSPDGLSINIGEGASGIRWWIGHLEELVAVGTRVRKGGRLGVISANHEAPHVHVGIDASALVGRELAHHDNYTHGAMTVGAQLKRAGYG